ncbi:hypothetical protein ACJX0J_040595, partial [Zea mays]
AHAVPILILLKINPLVKLSTMPVLIINKIHVSYIFAIFEFEYSTMLHTPLTTNLFLGLNQLDYTLNVFNGGKITECAPRILLTVLICYSSFMEYKLSL